MHEKNIKIYDIYIYKEWFFFKWTFKNLLAINFSFKVQTNLPPSLVLNEGTLKES